jgi:hypothetical protein
MAAVVKGTAYLFGVSGTITNARVLSFSATDAFGLAEETHNEDGVRVTKHMNDITTTASITIRMASGYSVPAIGTNLTYDSVTYWINSITRNQTNRGFRELTLEIEKSEGISLA